MYRVRLICCVKNMEWIPVDIIFYMRQSFLKKWRLRKCGRNFPEPEMQRMQFLQEWQRYWIRIEMQLTDSQRLKDQKMKSRLVLQVHDELLIEAYEPELDEVQNILKEEMEHAAELKVPLEIDMHTGDNWYEAK